MELFSLGGGRQPVMARGARRTGRRRSLPLQPFAPIWVAWRGRGEVATLTEAEPRAVPLTLSGERLYCGMYVNELLMRLTPRGEPFEDLFELYGQTISALEGTDALAPLLRTFEMALLAELGYGMLLTHTPEGEPVDATAWYEYVPAHGPRRVDGQGPVAVPGATLLAMAERDFTKTEVRHQSLGLMRRILDHYLDYRELKSRDLFARQPRRSPSEDQR